MNSALNNIDSGQAQAILTAIRTEILQNGIDESRVAVTGGSEPDAGSVISVGVLVDGADSNPLLIDTTDFSSSLEGQMDVLRAWLLAGHPAQTIQANTFEYKAGQRVPAPDAKEPVVAARDSYNSRVWVVSEREYQQASAPGAPRAKEMPYLILPDGSLYREFQHGLPD